MHALGQHLIGDFFACDPKRLNDAPYLEATLVELLQQLGATVINVTFHHFAPHGVSGVVVIQESHLAIHTWPEGGYAAIDLFTCGEQIDPLAALPALSRALQAQRTSHQYLSRGRYEDLPVMSQTYEPGSMLRPPVQITRDHWFTARSDTLALSLKLRGSRLHWHDSPQQRIEVYDSLAYGRFMALDGRIVISDRDERSYHEMLVHVPMHLLPGAKRALILGGGDGGAVRELLRYPQLQQIEVVEWDPAVPETVQRFFPQLGRGLRHPKVSLHPHEALAWLAAQPAGQLDLGLVDLVGSLHQWPQEQQARFTAELVRVLSPQGMLIMAGPDPRHEARAFQATYQRLRYAMPAGSLGVALVPLPTYPSGQLSLLLRSPQPMAFDQPQVAPDFSDCQMYHLAMHQAAFVLPNDLRQWIASLAD
jgi:spermidine synthase